MNNKIIYQSVLCTRISLSDWPFPNQKNLSTIIPIFFFNSDTKSQNNILTTFDIIGMFVGLVSKVRTNIMNSSFPIGPLSNKSITIQ